MSDNMYRYDFMYVWNTQVYKTKEKHIKVGFIFVGDEITPYTNNFIKARNHIKEMYGDRIECVTIYNVTEGQLEKPLQKLIDEGV